MRCNNRFLKDPDLSCHQKSDTRHHNQAGEVPGIVHARDGISLFEDELKF
jgi:hypothetical protein